MTLLVTATSIHGITVIADQRFSKTRYLHNAMPQTRPAYSSKKIFFSRAANVVFGIWGKDKKSAGIGSDLRKPKSFRKIVENFSKKIKQGHKLSDIANHLKEKLDSEYVINGQVLDRRGVHISGFEDCRPVVFHVHSGHPLIWETEEFNINCDSDNAPYQTAISSEHCCTTASGIIDFYLKNQLIGLPCPFPSNSLAQQEIEVRKNFLQIYNEISGLDRNYASTVGDSVDIFSFTSNGEERWKHESWVEFLTNCSPTEIQHRAPVGVSIGMSLGPIPTSFFHVQYKPEKK